MCVGEGGGGGRDKVRIRLSQHLRILLFIAGEPQKLSCRQKYISLESSFHKLLKNTTFRLFRAIGKSHNNASRIDRSVKRISACTSETISNLSCGYNK